MHIGCRRSQVVPTLSLPATGGVTDRRRNRDSHNPQQQIFPDESCDRSKGRNDGSALWGTQARASVPGTIWHRFITELENRILVIAGCDAIEQLRSLIEPWIDK